MWALASRVCRDHHLAEDVTQTVFVDLWSRPDRFDSSRGSLRSWLLTQAHARAVDLVRSEEARRRRQEHEATRNDAAVDLDTTIYVEELADEVRRAVDALPPAERDPILLAYFGGRTYREAAELLGQPEGTVKSRIRAGLRSLRTALAARGGDRVSLPSEHPHDELAVLALDALADDERAEVEDHVRGCPACAAELDDYRTTLSLVATEGTSAARRHLGRHRRAGRRRGNGHSRLPHRRPRRDRPTVSGAPAASRRA